MTPWLRDISGSRCFVLRSSRRIFCYLLIHRLRYRRLCASRLEEHRSDYHYFHRRPSSSWAREARPNLVHVYGAVSGCEVGANDCSTTRANKCEQVPAAVANLSTTSAGGEFSHLQSYGAAVDANGTAALRSCAIHDCDGTVGIPSANLVDQGVLMHHEDSAGVLLERCTFANNSGHAVTLADNSTGAVFSDNATLDVVSFVEGGLSAVPVAVQPVSAVPAAAFASLDDAWLAQTKKVLVCCLASL
jgi:hypothetical protein